MRKQKEANDLLFYYKKLPPVRQAEVLDYVKWLWVSPEEDFTEEEWKKLEKLAKQKGKSFESWEKASKHLKSMMK